MVKFSQFPREQWKPLRTLNPVESPFAAGRLRPAAAQRFKRVENAAAVIRKTLRIGANTFWRLDAPALLADVARGVVDVNSARAVNRGEKKAAAYFLTRPREGGPRRGPRRIPWRLGLLQV